MRLHRHLTFLTMTTALVAATAAGAWAQDTTSKETGVNLSGEAQPFDITSHLRAMHGMTVVNHKGQPLGTLFDVVIDFSNKEVIYALMSGQPGQRQGQQQTAEGEQQTAEGEQQEVGEASGNQQTAETESDGEQGRMAMGALYPIPIEAIEILDRSVLDAQVSKAQQTAKGEQATEGEQQTAEGEQVTTEGEQQTAEGEQQEVGEASGNQETAEAEGEGEQLTAEGEQQTAEGEQQTAEGAEEMPGAEQETAEGELQTAEDDQQTAESQEQPQTLAEMRVGDIVGMTVVSRDDETIADIQAIVQGSDQAVAVLGVGGFLGIGEKSVAVRLDQLALNQEGDALVLAATREDLENATEVEYESEQTVPDDTRVARLMESGQQGQSEQQAQSGQQEETEQQDQAEQQEETEQQAQSDQQEEAEQQDQAEQQGEAEQQDQMAAAETGAETKAGSPIAGEITTLKGKVLMVSISKEALQQAPSFEQGDFPEVADAEWQEAVLAFYEKILDTEGTDPALGTGDESTEGETTQ